MAKKKSGQDDKKEKRMAVTNIKVTKEAHGLLKTVSDMLGVPMSDAIILMIGEQYPNAKEEKQRREKNQERVLEHRSKLSDQN